MVSWLGRMQTSFWKQAFLVMCCILGISAATTEVTTFYEDYYEFIGSSAADKLHFPTRPLPLHWMAPLLSAGGFSSEALAFLKGLVAARTYSDKFFAISADQHGDSYNPSYVEGLPQVDRDLLRSLMAGASRPGIVVCHSEPGAWHFNATLAQKYRTSFCPSGVAAYKVGRTMFETDRLPAGWADRLNAMDEVWVPSHFAKSIFSNGGVKNDKILVLPESVDTQFFSPDAANPLVAHRYVPIRPAFCAGEVGSSAECPVRFLSVGKWERRKNFEGLLRSFISEFFTFGDSDGEKQSAVHVELYILTAAYHSSEDFEQEVQSVITSQLDCFSAESVLISQLYADSLQGVATVEVGEDGIQQARTNRAPSKLCINRENIPHFNVRKHIKLLHDIPQTTMPSIYAAMDAFVSPTRGEGWGRPHAEAMAMGLPVIATNWSGLTEFINANNSYPIRVHHMAPIPDGAFAGHQQAEADLLHLRSLLREVVSEPLAAKAKGQQGRKDMVEKFNLEHLGKFLAHQVARISDIVAKRNGD